MVSSGATFYSTLCSLTVVLVRAYDYPNGFDDVLEYPANRVLVGTGVSYHNYIDWSYSSPPWAVESTLPDQLYSNAGYALDALIADLSDSAYLSAAEELVAIDTVNDVMSYLFSAYSTFSSFFSNVENLKTAILNGPDELVYPAASAKFSTSENVFLTYLLQLDTNYAVYLSARELQAHPAHIDFPGNFSGAASPVSRSLNISGTYEGYDPKLIYSSATRSRWHSTGLYVKAGSIVVVKIPAEIASSEQVGIQVGCHRDDLSGKDELSRMPVITRGWPLNDEVLFFSLSSFLHLTYMQHILSIV